MDTIFALVYAITLWRFQDQGIVVMTSMSITILLIWIITKLNEILKELKK